MASKHRSGEAARLKRLVQARSGPLSCDVCGWRLPGSLEGALSTSPIHLHHVIPVACGGDEGPLNLLLLCPNHHAITHRLWPVSRNTYTGPADANALLAALREYDSDPEAFTLNVNRRRIEGEPQPWAETTHRGFSNW